MLLKLQKSKKKREINRQWMELDKKTKELIWEKKGKKKLSWYRRKTFWLVKLDLSLSWN